MGLDTTHDCWHGPYGRFLRFRNALCEAAGWTLEERTYPDGWTMKVPKEIDFEQLEEWNLEGDWGPEGNSRVPDDPLVVLIAHSDCSGWIRHRWCEPLARRLEALIATLEPSWRPDVEAFIAGLRLADERGEDVEFR